MNPLTVEVITYAPTVFYHCQHCEVAFQEMGIGERLRRVEAAGALPDDLARDFQAWSDWIHRLLERHGPRIRVRVIDAASIEGFIASVRHRVGRYPTVIVDGTEKRRGTDFDALDRLIETRLASVAAQRPSADRARERRV
jgi:hypothetical protein